MAGLKAALLSHPEEFVSTVTEKLLMYGIGRNVQYFDQPAIRAIVKASRAQQLHVCVAGSGSGEERAVPDAGDTGGRRSEDGEALMALKFE